MAIANRLLAQIARSSGGKLLDKAAARLFPVGKAAAVAGKPKSSITGAIAGAVITRLATRSVPGALIVGGGMLAKSLYDRRRAHRARRAEANNAEG